MDKAHALHGDKYDYSQVVYTKALSKVIINCPTHGAFTQAPAYHLSGNGCPACGREVLRRDTHMTKRLTTQAFIEASQRAYGDKYDYSQVNYTGNKVKVVVVCPTHGSYAVLPNNHMRGKSACPACRNVAVAERNKGNTYATVQRGVAKKSLDAHKAGVSADVNVAWETFTTVTTPIEATCVTHGTWKTTVSALKQGARCPQCAVTLRVLGAEHYNTALGALVDGKYTIVSVPDKRHGAVTMRCDKHGDFTMRLHDALHRHGCPSCGKRSSHAEQDIADLFISHGYDVIQRYRPEFMGRKELDVFVPALKLAVEYCGAHVHNADCNVLGGAPKAKTYHYDKWRVCRDNGITLITIFDFQWLHNREKVEAMLLHKMRRVTQRVFARKCELVELDRQTCWDFVKAHHIEGTGSWKLNCTYKGLRHEGELVAVMVVQDGDVKRSCTLAGVSVVGGVSRLFKAFPAGTTMMTTNDTGSSGTYGTKLEKYTLRYWWVKPNTSEYYTRYQCMKHKLESRFGTPVGDMTEAEYMLNMGYVRVYDSGLSYWVNT